MYFIGVDLGTSAVKLLLMREDGRVMNRTSRGYPISYPHPGWSEQNPLNWLKETKAGILELLSGCRASEVAGIGFAGQMHGLIALDQEDAIIRPAILWNDGRTGAETEYLNDAIGRKTLRNRTGNIAFAGFTAPKLLWMKTHEPEHFQRIRRIMLPKDYLSYMFSGAFCTDVSDASGTLLMDVKHKVWSDEMVNICGLNKEQLAAVHESFDVVGTVREEVARELGLPSSVRVVAGAGDNAAAAVGNGVVGDGKCNISLGTSGTVFLSGTTFLADENCALHSFAHADGNYHLLGCMLSAASANQWWHREILKNEALLKDQRRIKKLGENQVYFLPYLMGERSPHNDPFARAMFIGMSMDTSEADMAQAILEGVSFGLRDSIEIAKKLGLKPKTTRICGGGAKSELWCRMIANVMNLPVEIPQDDEGPALGAAILSSVGCNVYPDVETAAAQIFRAKKILEPERELVRKYQSGYERFSKLYPAVKEWYGGLEH